MSEVYEPTVIEQLEHQRDSAKILIERRQRAIRLSQNHDFRSLIMEGFCRDEAARYVQESGDPALPADSRMDALNMAQASGHLKRFLSMCVQAGAHSERTMPELEAELELARQEEGQG